MKWKAIIEFETNKVEFTAEEVREIISPVLKHKLLPGVITELSSTLNDFSQTHIWRYTWPTGT